jgi:hypothetical protein
LFEHLREYDTIIVTGPQRAGTRITAKMVAHDTGKDYIDETGINIDSLYRLTDAVSLGGCVVHAPALCRFVHRYGVDSIAIVMVKRPIADIIASQERIGWSWEQVEQLYYEGCGENTAPIAQVKYNYWQEQKKVITHWFEVNYQDLASHPLWIPKEKRRDFGSHQTK